MPTKWMMIIKRKKLKKQKKCVIKRILKFNDYEDGLLNKKNHTTITAKP